LAVLTLTRGPALLSFPPVHFSATDYMLFKDWLPTASNYFAAACIFCVALGMFDRLVRAPVRTPLEACS
jgi:hypothetical protein